MRNIPSIFTLAGLGISIVVLAGCESLEEKAKSFARSAALSTAQPLLEKVLLAEAPILPSSRSVYSTIPHLPGAAFDPKQYIKNKVEILADGNWKLPAGDYVIPVMTYCMKSSASSPNAHRYTLAALRGKNADIVKTLHAKALNNFPAKSIQLLSWAIQNGVPYEKLNAESKKIVDTELSSYKSRLSQPVFEKISKNWDEIAKRIPNFPTWSSLTDDVLDELGEVGDTIRSMRRYREVVQRNGQSYENISQLISLPGKSSQPGTEDTTPWSQLAPGVYARFLTESHYQQVGWWEVRVVANVTSNHFFAPTFASRSIWLPFKNFWELPLYAESGSKQIDPSGTVGDPGTGSIQPLGFSGLIGAAAAGTIARIPPRIAVPLLLGFMLAANWPAIYESLEKLGNSSPYPDLDKTIKDAQYMVREEHDALEKPIRDAGLLDGAKDTTRDPKNNTRQYDKTGGKEKLKQDFDNLPYPSTTAADGTKVKTLPDGKKVIYRPNATTDGTPPSLEVQPPDTGKKGNNPTRVKVRYP